MTTMTLAHVLATHEDTTKIIKTVAKPTAAAAAKSLQSCPTLCDLIDGSPPGSAIPGILQARTLEWIAISFSNAWKWKVKVKSLSRVLLLATPWTAAHQAPPAMGFSKQEHQSVVPLPSPAKPTRRRKYVLLIRYSWVECFTGKEEQMQLNHYFLKCPFPKRNQQAGQDRRGGGGGRWGGGRGGSLEGR